MPTALIVAAVIALLGIVFVVLGRDTWRWQNITLVTLFLLFGVLFFFLTSKNLAIQASWRKEIANFEKQLREGENKNKVLKEGKYDAAERKWIEPDASLEEWRRRVQLVMQGRGRVWQQVQCTNAAPDGSLLATVPQPTPPGIAEKTVLFVFDGTPSNAGAEYVGEFEVTKAEGQSVALSPVLALRASERARLTGRKGKLLTLYEIMPTDSHYWWAQFGPDQRVAFLSRDIPQDVKLEFANDGQAPAAGQPEGDQVWRRVKALRSFNAEVTSGGKTETQTVNEGTELILDPKSAEERIAAGDVAPVEGNDKVFRRSLRDYARLTRDLNLRIDDLLRSIKATNDQLAVVQVAQKKVEADLAFREKQQASLSKDKTRFLAENERVKAHVTALEAELARVNGELRKAYDDNVKLEEELVKVTYELANILRSRVVAGN
jgi:hypothetical protein